MSGARRHNTTLTQKGVLTIGQAEEAFNVPSHASCIVSYKTN